MRIPIVTFAEYAAVDTAGKLVIAGTVDGISFRRPPGARPQPEGPVPIPALYLVAVLEGSIGDGLRHRLGLAVLNEDKQEVVKRVNHGEFHFRASGGLNLPGRRAETQCMCCLLYTSPSPRDS